MYPKPCSYPRIPVKGVEIFFPGTVPSLRVLVPDCAAMTSLLVVLVTTLTIIRHKKRNLHKTLVDSPCHLLK